VTDTIGFLAVPDTTACSLVWAGRLAGASGGDPATAVAVLRGADDGYRAPNPAGYLP